MMADAGLDLDIMFEDCNISVPNEALLFVKNNDNDPYIVMEGGKSLKISTFVIMLPFRGYTQIQT